MVLKKESLSFRNTEVCMNVMSGLFFKIIQWTGDSKRVQMKEDGPCFDQR